jgi:uncharacterized protein YecE (DUF72 family)
VPQGDRLFYPEKTMSADGRLPHYLRHLPIVEVEGSYDARPCARNATPWVERTAQDFAFDVKAFRIFTGTYTPPSALPEDIREALVKETGPKRKAVPPNWYPRLSPTRSPSAIPRSSCG